MDILSITKQLDKANKQITTILESITEGFYTLDNDWCFTYINTQAEKLLDLDRTIHLGKNIWASFPELKVSTLYKKYLQSKKENKPVYFELTGIYKTVWAEVRVYPSEEGLSVFFRDISQRKQDELELNLIKERFSKAFNSNLIGIAITSFDEGLFIDANDNFLAIINYQREEIIGKTLSELRILQKPSRHDLLKMFGKYGRIHDLEVIYKTKNGKTVTGLYNGEIIQLHGTKCILVMVADISEKKVMEQEIGRLDRLNLIGQMAAGIGHEVRNPMTTVRGFLQLFSQREEYLKDKNFFELMISEIDRANYIISEFLSLANNKQIEQRETCLNELLDNMYPLLQVDALKYDISIVLDKNTIPKLLLDEKEIRQLVINLVRNSLEATKPGGNIILKTYYEDEKIVFLIKDEGCGIPEDIINKLGTPFLTTKDSGTGLGLSVCYSIANRHKAAIEVESSPEGTCFYVKFNTP